MSNPMVTSPRRHVFNPEDRRGTRDQSTPAVVSDVDAPRRYPASGGNPIPWRRYLFNGEAAEPHERACHRMKATASSCSGGFALRRLDCIAATRRDICLALLWGGPYQPPTNGNSQRSRNRQTQETQTSAAPRAVWLPKPADADQRPLPACRRASAPRAAEPATAVRVRCTRNTRA